MCCRRTELLLVLWVSTAHLAISMPSEFCNMGIDPFSEATALEELGLELFEQWMVKHGKVYSHPAEKARRFENFQSNLRYITERNARRKPSSASHVVGLNQFADLTNEEFKAMYVSGMVKNDRKRRRGRMGTGTEGKEKACEAPYSLDWRTRGAVTPVKNQGQCGSCWAFSSTGAMEGINAITTGDLMSLSEQELVDCDTSNEGCNGGDMDYAFEWVINNGGIDTESNYPYIGVDATCNYAKEQIKAVTIDGYQDVDSNESSLLCAVVKQPVSVGIDGSSLDFQLYTGGIYDGDCSSNPDDIDHAVLIVGYGSQGGTDYWIVKNSWGTSWGLQGYIYIRRNTGLPYGVCAINSMASYPTKHSTSPAPFPSPAMPPPPPPPFPPSPLPSQCGDWSYCPEEETCCCLFEFQGFCLLYGCCPSENAVCCAGTIFCCPQNYPICDIQDGLCLQSNGDTVGIVAKKPKLAKHKLPWTRFEGTSNTYKSLLWKRERLEAMR